MSDYASQKTFGFSATDFYKKFNVNIKSVGDALGLCRETVSKIPAGAVSMDSKEKVISYLEKISKQEYETAIKNFEKAGEEYQMRKKILSDYREKYEMLINEGGKKNE